MEKFMLLFRGSDVYQPGQSPEALQALKQKMIHWVVDLSKKGVHVASEPLEPTGKQVSGKKKNDRCPLWRGKGNYWGLYHCAGQRY
jgi:hypothetical protein